MKYVSQRHGGVTQGHVLRVMPPRGWVQTWRIGVALADLIRPEIATRLYRSGCVKGDPEEREKKAAAAPIECQIARGRTRLVSRVMSNLHRQGCIELRRIPDRGIEYRLTGKGRRMRLVAMDELSDTIIPEPE